MLRVSVRILEKPEIATGTGLQMVVRFCSCRIVEQERISHLLIDFQVESVAQGLLSFDLEPGSRVGILSPTCHRYIVCQFAAAKAGLTLVRY